MTRCTVVIPTVPGRESMLSRALESVANQEEHCLTVVVADDEFTGRWRLGGAARTRNRGLAQVETEWVAFLDDDDEMYPQHVSRCLSKGVDTRADLVYPWFDGNTSEGFLWAPWDGELVSPEGREFGPEQAEYMMGGHKETAENFIPTPVVAQTAKVREAGGFPEDWRCEERGLWAAMLANGAKFVHLPERTWKYHVHGKHYSWVHWQGESYR